MKKKLQFKIFLFLIFFLGLFGLAEVSEASADPVLHFSDITSGPKTGLNDGLGSGAIVTIWGNNLESSKGASKVYIGTPGGTYVEAAYYYYWKNADGTLPGGPADLYSRHKMQEIAFSIPATAPTGSQKIWVNVGGVDSNQLDFNVTSSGNIYFVKTTGNNSNPGTWANPWLTMDKCGNTISAGDICYFLHGVQDADYFKLMSRVGSANNLVGFAAYPNSTVTSVGIGNDSVSNYYVAISKLSSTFGADAFPFSRLVGLSLTDNGIPGSCCSLFGGAARQEGSKNYGIYIHDQTATTSNQMHTTYFTIRHNVSGKSSIQGFEFAWSYLKNNGARGGIHFYDEHGCGSYTTPVYVHSNYVEQQTGVGFDILVGACDQGYSMDSNTLIYVYNNVFYKTGKNNALGYAKDAAVQVAGTGNYATVKFYNNVIYDYSESGTCTDCGALYTPSSGNKVFMGKLEYVNNIVYDTTNNPYLAATNGTKTPTVSSNNIWYNGGDGNPASPPAWDTNPITTDPQFTNPATNNFTLQDNSPAISSGLELNATFLNDILGNIRGSVWDIGAYEYSAGGGDITPPAAPSGLSVI